MVPTSIGLPSRILDLDWTKRALAFVVVSFYIFVFGYV